MQYLNKSSRVFFVLAFMLAAAVVLAACQDEIEDAIDEAATPTEEPADIPATPEVAETPTEAPDDDAVEEEPAPTPDPEAESSPVPDHDEVDDETGATPRSVLVYLVRNEEIAAASRDIAGTPEVATGALNELFTGITPYEHDLGLGTEIPADTRLMDIALQDDGTLIVDLSPDFEAGGGSFSMRMRLAQVVFTATQFDTVNQVQFRIDGQEVDAIGGEGVMVDQPLTRDDFEDLSPAILLESPTPGDVVSSPIRLEGTSNTFEATMQIEMIDSAGEVIYRDFATATSGTGTRGTFDVTVDVDIQNEGFGTITMFEESAEDGSRINIVQISVDFRK